MKKILITGSNGFVGRFFIKRYSNQYQITPISLQLNEISSIDFSNVETILHLSALVHQKKILPFEDYLKINTTQTIALAKTAKINGVKHFVFFSTVAVYGENGSIDEKKAPLINEASQCNPIDSYGKSKYLAEQSLQALEDENFIISIIRPPLIYGADCPGNMSSLAKIIKKFPALPFNYSDNKRSMIFIENLLEFTHLIISKKINGVSIPQDIQNLSIKEICQTIAQGYNKQIFLFRFPKFIFYYLLKIRKRTMSSLYGTLVFDSTISNSRTGFIAQYSTEEALLSMARSTSKNIN